MIGEYIHISLMAIIVIALFIILKSPKKGEDKEES